MATQLTDFVSVIGLAFLWERGKGKGERGDCVVGVLQSLTIKPCWFAPECGKICRASQKQGQCHLLF
jgi:hypothetical protein